MDGLIAELPRDREFVRTLGQGALLGIPMPILLSTAVATLVHLLLTRTRAGRFL